jgi:hypothetical protein
MKKTSLLLAFLVATTCPGLVVSANLRKAKSTTTAVRASSAQLIQLKCTPTIENSPGTPGYMGYLIKIDLAQGLYVIHRLSQSGWSSEAPQPLAENFGGVTETTIEFPQVSTTWPMQRVLNRVTGTFEETYVVIRSRRTFVTVSTTCKREPWQGFDRAPSVPRQF